MGKLVRFRYWKQAQKEVKEKQLDFFLRIMFFKHCPHYKNNIFFPDHSLKCNEKQTQKQQHVKDVDYIAEDP